MADKQKYIGRANLKDAPSKPLKLIIGDKVVKNKHLDDSSIDSRVIGAGNVKEVNIDSEAITNEKVKPETLTLDRMEKELQDMILSKAEHGVTVSSVFGQEEHISISQKTLTKAIMDIWDKISDITGEEYAGISMKVTPNYIISNSGATVNITATPNGSNGSVFEHIEFFVNSTLVYEADNVSVVNTTAEIGGRSVIACNAKIMGITYSKSVTVEQYSEFFIGFGDSYSAIMTEDYARHLEDIGDLRGNYNLQCNDNNKLFIVMNADMADAFIRADMNGVEIPFGRDFVTVDNVRFLVMTSTNSYNEGLYNIDINS